MYNVYQHWDQLKVVLVGKSYPPEIYDYITNKKVRSVFYKIAEETEEDYQKLCRLLESFKVDVIRMDIEQEIEEAKIRIKNKQIIQSPGPFMQPRDSTIMLGKSFHYYESIENNLRTLINILKEQNNLAVKNRLYNDVKVGNLIYKQKLNGAMTSRIGKDLIIGTTHVAEQINIDDTIKKLSKLLPEYRIKIVDTIGHTDGTFCPVVPGLIFSILDSKNCNYAETFPGWEVVYLENESWPKVHDFLVLKEKNKGKWRVVGQELNDDFTDYVEKWMNHWVGYVEESVFDVNMLVIDKNNVIVNGYNKIAFDAFNRYNITPHICNFRHRYFWDGGLHCITSDIHREGVMEDYFPTN